MEEEAVTIKEPDQEQAEEDHADGILPSESTEWYCGDYRITAGLGLFTLFSVVIVSVTLFAVINITLDQNVSLWYGVLSLILGVVLEPPKVNSSRRTMKKDKQK